MHGPAAGRALDPAGAGEGVQEFGAEPAGDVVALLGPVEAKTKQRPPG